MTISDNLINSFIKATERAAYGASFYRGKNDKIAADQAAVDEMRQELNKIDILMKRLDHNMVKNLISQLILLREQILQLKIYLMLYQF